MKPVQKQLLIFLACITVVVLLLALWHQQRDPDLYVNKAFLELEQRLSR